jgi:hypothetical protein
MFNLINYLAAPWWHRKLIDIARAGAVRSGDPP